jgi:hypothetical protein
MSEKKLTIEINREQTIYMIVFFPIARYTRVDNMFTLTVFGVIVFCGIDRCRWCLGYSWTKKEGVK